jgi:hypothetical protein
MTFGVEKVVVWRWRWGNFGRKRGTMEVVMGRRCSFFCNKGVIFHGNQGEKKIVLRKWERKR